MSSLMKRNSIICLLLHYPAVNRKSAVAVNSLWNSILVPVDFFRIFHYNITLVLAREIPGGRFKCTLGEVSSFLLSRGRGKISHCFERQYCRRRVFRHCSRLDKLLLTGENYGAGRVGEVVGKLSCRREKEWKKGREMQFFACIAGDRAI